MAKSKDKPMANTIYAIYQKFLEKLNSISINALQLPEH